MQLHLFVLPKCLNTLQTGLTTLQRYRCRSRIVCLSRNMLHPIVRFRHLRFVFNFHGLFRDIAVFFFFYVSLKIGRSVFNILHYCSFNQCLISISSGKDTFFMVISYVSSFYILSLLGLRPKNCKSIYYYTYNSVNAIYCVNISNLEIGSYRRYYWGYSSYAGQASLISIFTQWMQMVLEMEIEH